MSEETTSKMSSKEFWIRFSIWSLLAAVGPVAFLAWRYGLFSQSGGSGVSLSGWGILSIVLLSIFFIYIVKKAKKGMPEGSMAVQCIDGYSALVPLLAVIGILQTIKTNVSYFEEALIVVFVFEALAIPVNPMPKWAAQNNLERKSNLLTDIIKNAIKGSKDTTNGGK
jgi:hypothetical protein